MKGVSITVRKATAADRDTIVGHNIAMAHETEGVELEPDTVMRGVEELLNRPERGFYLLAEVGGSPAGQAMVTYEWSDWRCADFWWLQSVYVRPESRGKGVFTALLSELAKGAKESGACGLRLYVLEENRGARTTYEHLGMAPSRYVMYEHSLDGGEA